MVVVVVEAVMVVGWAQGTRVNEVEGTGTVLYVLTACVAVGSGTSTIGSQWQWQCALRAAGCAHSDRMVRVQ